MVAAGTGEALPGPAAACCCVGADPSYNRRIGREVGGCRARHFARISNYAVGRLALFVAKRHKRASGYGLSVVVYMSPNRLGLVNLDGTVVSTRASKPWRAKPNAAGERRR